MPSIADWLILLRQRLAAVSDSPALDAQVLLAHILERSRPWVLAHPEVSLPPNQEQALHLALARLEKGQPLPYVIGHWEFYGLDLLVSPAALIPRPETELLVEQGLAWLSDHPGPRWALDVGTGSGCIAIALAANRPDLRTAACDLSLEALKLAQRSVQKHHLGARVLLLQADLIPPTNLIFDLICANLPYIPTHKLSGLRVAQAEPVSALDGGPDGLEVIRRLLARAPLALAPQGLLLLEIEASQGEAARELAQAYFPQAQVEVLPDLAGHDRLVKVRQERATPAIHAG
ncbi:MAG: peptide chain release factor N(5)-glutamine methyltransferase [Anaerolineales bacterium]|nr:peptide chain release factor N(5)-glutamine methyltransferase [Anaerolineales bacterium]